MPLAVVTALPLFSFLLTYDRSPPHMYDRFTTRAITVIIIQITWNVTPSEVEELVKRRDTFLDFGFGNETGYFRVTESASQPRPLPYREPFAPVGETSDETVSAGPGPTGASSSRLPPPFRSSSTSPSSSTSSVEVAGKYSTQIFAERALEVGVRGT